MSDLIATGFIWSLPALGFGALAAYIDIDSFFRSARTSYTVSGNFRCYWFIFVNGALSAGLLIWAIESEPNSVINSIIHVDSSAAKLLVIAFAVPVVLRSRVFSFGENQTPAGLAIAYDWARLKVLYDINMRSALVKDQLSDDYANRLQGKANIPITVKDLVDNYVKPFATQAEKAQLQREFDEIQAAYTGPNALTVDHIRRLARWALDSTSIGYVKNRLAR